LEAIMSARVVVSFLLAASILSTAASGQDKPAAPAPAGRGTANASATGPVGAVVEREVKGLSSESFPEREAALKRLQTLVAEQLKQRAAVQEVLATFQADLVQQQRALAMVSDEEAQAQIAGLLEMERGLTAWTIQTMAEPLERRQTLLAWGLTKDNGPTLARAYSGSLRVRLDGIKQIAKSNDEGASWTLARLINDRETAIRAAAMAASWSRKPNSDVVNALWFRAVTGPLARENNMNGPVGIMEGRMGVGMVMEAMAMNGNGMIKVDFPGGDPMEFDDSGEGNEFFDALLASAVLVHLDSPLVAEKVKALVDERAKAGKSLCQPTDPDWTLVSHRLVETYSVKEAVPILAQEALGIETEEMGGDMNGRPFMWSRRTIAIGTLAKLIGKDPADFDLIRARDMGNPRGWMWAVDVNPQAMMNGNGENDLVAVKAFYAFWKDHHAEFGVKEVPSNAAVSQPARPNRFFKGMPMPPDGPVQILPAQPDGPQAVPGEAPDANPPVPPPMRTVPLMRGGAAG
jgi:hypothetical protein